VGEGVGTPVGVGVGAYERHNPQLHGQHVRISGCVEQYLVLILHVSVHFQPEWARRHGSSS
jgi:hypothetical protein